MSEENGSPPKRLEICKYPNRRYYDSTRSRHVTLEQINSLIRHGYEVTVTDSKTGEDITAKVLAQIILELDSMKLGIFPVPLLHRLIRANEQLVNDFVEKYFNQALAAFLDSQKTFEQSLRQAMGLQPNNWAKMMFGPLAAPFWSGAGSRRPEPAAEAAGQASQEELQKQVEQLRRQVELMQSQVKSSKVSAKPRRGGKRGGNGERLNP